MTSQGLAPVPASSTLEYVEDQIQSPDLSNSPATQPTALKRKRNLPGTPDPDSEVVALSPNSLMATNRFLCELCNKGFQRDQNLQLHRRGHNLPWKLKQRSNKEIVKKVYICPEKSCVHHDPSRALGDLTGIKKHFSRKHGEKKWKCDRCPKKYAVKSDWKAHSKICGTREHKCDCGTLFSRKDSFITHRAFCSAVADQSGSRYTPSAAGTNNLLSSGNGFLSGTFGNPQITETHQFSGGSGGFYPASFHPYGHLDGSKSIRLERHPLNASTHFVTGNPAANLTHELLLQHAGQTNLFGSSSSSGAPCPDQSAFGNVNMFSLDQMIGNTSDGGGVMQVKREVEILSNEDFVENMASLDNPTNLNQQQQQQAITSNQYANQFLSSFLGRNNNGHLRYGLSNGQEFIMGNNGFAENSFFNSSFNRPSPVSKDWAENLNHLILMHEATAAATVKQETQQQAVESSQTRDFLGVGGNEISREQLLLAASSEQLSQSNSAADLDMCRHNQH